MARWAPTREPTFFTQLSQVLGDSWPWQTLKTLLPLGYNNSVRDLVLRNSWGRGVGRAQRAGNVSQWEKPGARGALLEFSSLWLTGLLPCLTWPGLLLLGQCVSERLPVSIPPRPLNKAEVWNPQQGLKCYVYSWASSVEAALWKQKITSLPWEELVELLEVSTLTVGDWNLDYHLLKKEDLVHSFSLIHGNK